MSLESEVFLILRRNITYFGVQVGLNRDGHLFGATTRFQPGEVAKILTARGRLIYRL